MAFKRQPGFAVWITGLPASGKSTLAAVLQTQLASRGVDVAVLESDELRKVFTPEPRYDSKERDLFYRQIVFVGALLTSHGVPVIFDATANRRMYREFGRQRIPRFLEVYIDTALQICIARDPKAIYRQARVGKASTVPGVQADYEVPRNPDLVVSGDRDNMETAAERVITKLLERSYLEAGE